MQQGRRLSMSQALIITLRLAARMEAKTDGIRPAAQPTTPLFGHELGFS